MANTPTARKPQRPSRYLWLVRALFLLLGVIPVVAVAALSAKNSLPGFRTAQKEEWQRELSRRLGTSVEIQSVQYPAPHIARLKGLVLSHPETHKPLLRAAHVEVLSTTEGFHVHCPSPEFVASNVDWLKHLAERAMLDMPSEELSPVTMELSDLHLPLGPQQSQTLQSVALQLTPTKEGPTALLQFHLPGESAETPCELSLQRDRTQDPPSTLWQVKTSASGLPVRLLTPFVPSAIALGDQTNFQGTASLTQNGKSHLHVTGQLGPIDLDRLIAQPFRLPLSGKATLTLDDSLIEDGRLSKAQGTIQCNNGIIGRELFSAAKSQFQLEGALPTSGTGPIRFQHLHVNFQLAADRLSLASRNPDPAGKNVLLATRLEALLIAPSNHSVDAAGTRIARTLVPSLESQLTTNPTVVALLAWLPRSVSPASPSAPTRPANRPLQPSSANASESPRVIYEN